jgi:phosphate transport system substrate-binding protein
MKMTLARLLILATTLAPLTHAPGQALAVRGSDTLLGLSQKWADAYKAKHPGVMFQVTGGGAPAAFAALADKKLDIVLASRSIRYQEAKACEASFGKRPVECKVAVSGLAVYVNSSNRVAELTYDELHSIYRGKGSSWKELGGKELPISVYAQGTNSLYGELFGEEVLNGEEVAPAVHVVPDAEVLQAVAHDPKAIGFGALASAEGVRPVEIKRVFSSTPIAPSAEAIANRTYPISRFVFCYTSPSTNQPEIKAYLDWIRSDEGQQVAREAGFYPLPAKWRSSQ